MARNRSSRFDVTEGLGFVTNSSQGTIVEHEVQDVHEVHEVLEKLDNKKPKELGTTQGKKGERLKRINMAFSDLNHEYITHESRRRGISCTAFVNQIIEEYRCK